ncbi:RDD family protein [Streptomyces sp. NPDC000229]|uniref:RDD family protein n=1 Tax=Streptomyces sp. NPDC000229 TaxID=3154247 RepID=UPI0033186CDB
MSAPTPATGDGSPTPGYYPDPSIPGYIRFWNGAAWVPGTSRPAPKDGEVTPPAPAASAPAPAPTPSVEETGPVFFDEEEATAESRPEPEPASVWQADASRQAGFGGDRDRRISWGAEAGQDPRRPATAAPDPTGGALPGVRNVEPAKAAAPEGTVTIRAVKPQSQQPEQAQQPRPEQPADGTMTIRALNPDAPRTPQVPAQPQQSQPAAPAAAPQPLPATAAATPAPAAAAAPATAPAPPAPTPVTHGPGGGSASWAQQVHQLARPAQPEAHAPARPQDPSQQPVLPWKPPVNDPFLAAAQAQAAARPAGLGKRLVARLIDTLVLGAAVAAVAVPFVSKALDHIDGKIQQAKQSGETVTVWLLDGTTSTYFGIALAALLVLGVLYEALPTAKWGRTLGKKLMGLEVRDIESHEPPPFGAALRRWLVYGVLGILVIGVVNVLWALVDRPWRQCWHDKAAHTFVAGT